MCCLMIGFPSVPSSHVYVLYLEKSAPGSEMTFTFWALTVTGARAIKAITIKVFISACPTNRNMGNLKEVEVRQILSFFTVFTGSRFESVSTGTGKRIMTVHAHK